MQKSCWSLYIQCIILWAQVEANWAINAIHLISYFMRPCFKRTANSNKTQRNLLRQPNNLEEGWTLCGVPLVFNMNRCKMQRSWRSLVGEQKHCYLGKSQCIYGQVMKLEFHCFTVICLWQMFEDSFFWLVTPISKYVM